MDSLFALLASPAAWLALATLVVMEVVLGIDNLVFVALVSNKLPEESRRRGRAVGLGLVLLSALVFIVGLTKPVLTLFGHAFSWRDLILLAGGLFLVWKATSEIHHSVDPDPGDDIFESKASIGFAAAIAQILMLDIVFSIDSIITAVGMTEHVPIMIIAVIVA